MFKKPKNAKKRKLQQQQQQRRRQDDDDEASEPTAATKGTEPEEEGTAATTSVLDRIRETRKKQKILASLPAAKGGGGGHRRNTQTADGEDDPHAADRTVLEQKHQRAMEEFINGQIDGGNTTSKEAAPTKTEDSEDLLYRELAQATVPSELFSERDGADDDKGAVLVGGTGIAEVVLPDDQRKVPAAARKNHGIRVQNRSIHYSSAAAAAPGGEGALEHTPASFRSMVPNRQQQQQQQPPSQQQQQQEAGSAAAAKEAPSEPTEADADEERLGFDAFRRRTKGGHHRPAGNSGPGNQPKHHRHQHQRDHEVYTKFLQRQRNKR